MEKYLKGQMSGQPSLKGASLLCSKCKQTPVALQKRKTGGPCQLCFNHGLWPLWHFWWYRGDMVLMTTAPWTALVG